MQCGQGQGLLQNRRRTTLITPGQHVFALRSALSSVLVQDESNDLDYELRSFLAWSDVRFLLGRIDEALALPHNVHFAMRSRLAIINGRMRGHGMREVSDMGRVGDRAELSFLRMALCSLHPSRLSYTNGASITYRYMNSSAAMLVSKLVRRQTPVSSQWYELASSDESYDPPSHNGAFGGEEAPPTAAARNSKSTGRLQTFVHRTWVVYRYARLRYHERVTEAMAQLMLRTSTNLEVGSERQLIRCR